MRLNNLQPNDGSAPARARLPGEATKASMRVQAVPTSMVLKAVRCR